LERLESDILPPTPQPWLKQAIAGRRSSITHDSRTNIRSGSSAEKDIKINCLGSKAMSVFPNDKGKMGINPTKSTTQGI